jgi:hypothetical protein
LDYELKLKFKSENVYGPKWIHNKRT